MGASGTSSEADLLTSSSEERTRTFDAVPASNTGKPLAGPASGDTLNNRFVLHECRADGAGTRVFRALDRRLEAAGESDPWVALKVVTAEPGNEPRPLQALRREAAIAQGLTHPNLPRIHGIDHDGPHSFLCMGWVEGESLATILDSRGARPMTRLQAVHLVEGVCRALAHLHARGITHSDVKPGNILVTAGGDATLLDFGVAVGPGAGDLTELKGFTPEYASPEVLAGATPTPADDLFSVACVAYRMLSGQRPFGPGTAAEAAAASNRPACPASVSPGQWRALDRALAFTRSGRQPDVGTFLSQLKGARDDSAVVTEPSQPPSPADDPPTTASGIAGESAPPRRFLPVLAGLALLAGLLAGAVLWLGGDPEPPPVAEVPDAAPRQLPVPTPAAPPAAIEAPAAAAATAPERVAPRPAATASDSPKRITPPKTRPATDELVGPPRPAPAPATPTGTADPAPATTATPGGTPLATASAAPELRQVAFSSLTLRNYVEADYPRNAAARRIAGWVDVAFTVDAAGRPGNARVVDSEPAGMFEDAALSAVRRWRFAASSADSAPVSTRIRVRFDPR
ncbi:MAG: TonB family protein [Gammaproteobacteria bacterium]